MRLHVGVTPFTRGPYITIETRQVEVCLELVPFKPKKARSFAGNHQFKAGITQPSPRYGLTLHLLWFLCTIYWNHDRTWRVVHDLWYALSGAYTWQLHESHVGRRFRERLKILKDTVAGANSNGGLFRRVACSNQQQKEVV